MNIATDAAARKPKDEEILRVLSFFAERELLLSFVSSDGRECPLGPEDAIAYLSDPLALDARWCGVSTDDLIEFLICDWHASCVECGAYAGRNRTPLGWLANDKRTTCDKHGGY